MDKPFILVVLENGFVVLSYGGREEKVFNIKSDTCRIYIQNCGEGVCERERGND